MTYLHFLRIALHEIDQTQAAFKRTILGSALFEALVTRLLILTAEAMLHPETKRIADEGSLIQKHSREGDLTALIAAARKAACKFTSKELHGAYIAWSYSFPGSASSMAFPAFNIGTNKTPNDVLISIGDVELYLQNNLALACQRIRERAVEAGLTYAPPSFCRLIQFPLASD